MKRPRLPRWAIVSLLAAVVLAGAYLWLHHWVRDAGAMELHSAAANGDVRRVNMLLLLGPDVDTKDTYWGHTPLHEVACGVPHRGRGNEAAIIRSLVKRGADPNGQDRSGATPLHHAAWLGHTDSVRALLEFGADQGKTDCDGKTPYDRAREWNQTESMVLLKPKP